MKHYVMYFKSPKQQDTVSDPKIVSAKNKDELRRMGYREGVIRASEGFEDLHEAKMVLASYTGDYSKID